MDEGSMDEMSSMPGGAMEDESMPGDKGMSGDEDRCRTTRGCQGGGMNDEAVPGG